MCLTKVTRSILDGFTLSLVVSQPILGNDPGAVNTLSSPTVISTVQLYPQPDNEVELDEVELDTLLDGSSRVRMRISLEPGKAESFIYVVDKDLGTYVTERIPQTFTQSLTIEPQDYRPPAKMMSERDRESEVAPPGSIGWCDYQATAVIVHFDPVFVELVITSSSMAWRHDFSSNCLSMKQTSKLCWANPETPVPPPLGPTHWFLDACIDVNNTISQQHLQKSTSGQYHNWAWLDPAKQTWAFHGIQIDARTSLATFLVSDTDGGESSSIIFGVQEISTKLLDCFP